MIDKKFYIYGRHSLKQAITFCPHLILQIYLQKNFKHEFENSAHIKAISYIAKTKLDELVNTNRHQGIAALIKNNTQTEKDFKKYLSNNREDKCTIVVLEKIQDPRNLGACLRLAKAFDVDALIISKNSSCSINSTVVKSSAGYALAVNIFLISNINRILDLLIKENIWLFGLDSKGVNDLAKTNFPKRTALIIGSEKGMSLSVKNKCDETIKIKTNVESLNLSTAMAISLYSLLSKK